MLLRTFLSFERKKSSGEKFAAKLRYLHQNFLIAKDLQIAPGNFLFIPLTVAGTCGFCGAIKRLSFSMLNHTSNGILHHFYGKSLWNAMAQVLGALLFIINDLQKVVTQGLDVKKRRCKSWFSATSALSFILPKVSPCSGIL